MAKLPLDIASEIDNKLTEIAARNGISKAEATRTAFALPVVADQEKHRGDGFSRGIVREDADHKLEAIGRVVGF